MQQEYVLDLLKDGKNIFLTGPGGVGKSYILKKFHDWCKQNKKKIGFTSTTGISALNIGGRTLHSFLKIGLGQTPLEYMKQNYNKTPSTARIFKWVQILVIDEVSMLSPDLFDKLENFFRYVKNNDKPFGGIQIVVSGDFCQLPCVDSSKFCFEAESWKKCFDDSNTFYLTKIFRQEDEKFQKCLNEIRIAELSQDTINILESCLEKKIENEFGIEPTIIFPTKIDVEKINDDKLDELAIDNNQFYEYEMTTNFIGNCFGIDKDQQIEKYRKNLQAPIKLQLCIGAQVMLLVNLDLIGGLCNGSRGVVIDFVEEFPKVRFTNGEEMVLTKHVWSFDYDNKPFIEFIQVPLMVAYAITIHKSQGSTLDCVIVDLKNIFEYGQVYTALSRVKSIEGLSIKNMSIDKIKCHPVVKTFYKELKGN